MENNKLQKNLGFAAALSTVVGMVIGGGVFFKPQAVYTATGGAPGLGMIAWVIAGVMTIAAGLTAAEISAAIPKTGGMMVYIEEIYSKKLGFLTGWMQVVLFFPATIAALAVMFGQQSAGLIGNESLVLPITIGVILLISVLNSLGSKTGGLIQTVATVGKLIPLALIIVFGFVKGGGNNPILTPMVGEGVSAGGVVGSLLIAILFAYDGWINVGAIAGSPASAVAEAIFGPFGGKFITVGILISVFGALNGYLLTGPRILFTLGTQKSLPASNFFGSVNKNGVPANATLTMGVVACLYALTGQFNLLTDLSMFAVWAFYVLTFIGVFKLRKDQPNLERPYKVPLYPFIPMIAIAGGLFVVVSQLLLSGFTNTMISLGGVVITLIGLPIYSFVQKSNSNNNDLDKTA